MIKLDDKFTEFFSPREQLVMLRLLFGADKDGMAEITTRNFAELCGMTRQQLRTTFIGLSRKGEIEIVVSKKTHLKSNPKGNPKSTFVFVCNYDNYNAGKKKATQNAPQNPTQSAIAALQDKCREREKVFEQSLVPFVISRGGIYQPAMIRAFFNYWTERNKSGTKMRFELERTWETSKRLATWAGNEKQFNRNGQSVNNSRTSAADKAASRESLSEMARAVLEQH